MFKAAEESELPPETFDQLVPWRIVANELAVCTRSLSRWKLTDPLFPPVLKINDRKYLTRSSFTEYKTALMRRGLGAG